MLSEFHLYLLLSRIINYFLWLRYPAPLPISSSVSYLIVLFELLLGLLNFSFQFGFLFLYICLFNEFIFHILQCPHLLSSVFLPMNHFVPIFELIHVLYMFWPPWTWIILLSSVYWISFKMLSLGVADIFCDLSQLLFILVLICFGNGTWALEFRVFVVFCFDPGDWHPRWDVWQDNL